MVVSCENCSKKVNRRPSQVKRAKHISCSRECADELKKKLNKIPYSCKECDKISYTTKGEIRLFCTSSCAATYNNKQKIKIKKNCIQCGMKLHAGIKFCNATCKATYYFNLKVIDYLKGILASLGKTHTRRFLIEKDGYRCNCCSIFEWNSKPIVLEVEHKDGNSENDRPENLELLCPNCHSQTDTYKAKNIGKGRHSRRKRYAEGKSY